MGGWAFICALISGWALNVDPPPVNLGVGVLFGSLALVLTVGYVINELESKRLARDLVRTQAKNTQAVREEMTP